MHFLNDKEVVINQLWPQKKGKEKRSNDWNFWHIRYWGMARQNQPLAVYWLILIKRSILKIFTILFIRTVQGSGPWINQLWPQKRKEKEKRSNDQSFWHIRYWGIARQNQPRAAYTPLCIIYLWQLKNHHQMLSSDVPVMLAVTGNTVQEFGKIESIQSPWKTFPH